MKDEGDMNVLFRIMLRLIAPLGKFLLRLIQAVLLLMIETSTVLNQEVAHPLGRQMEKFQTDLHKIYLRKVIDNSLM